jgi:2-amino-4-hydroxy-6-hydroxymethyldihydropteridine diphosphokinase
MKTVYLSLGSNVGDREAALQQAISHLHGPDLRLVRLSSVYETAPVDLAAQPMFLNIVVQAETSLFPMRLLLRVANVERKMGRTRRSPKGPRNIDIDILIYGHAVVETPSLVIPHESMHKRRFVLEPLLELAPDLRHPVLNRSVKEMLAGTTGQQVRRTELKLHLPE